MFDEKYLQELNVRYESMNRKHTIYLILGFGLFIVGFLPIGLERKNIIPTGFLTPYYPVCIGLIAVGIYISTYIFNVLDAYKLLANNDSFTNRVGFKFRKKLREKFDEF